MAGERVLVADDEQGIRHLLTSLCEREGYQVDAAPDGARALGALDEALYDLAIVDLKMPGASGIEVLRHARDVQPECEVIILTGYADLSSAVEALRLGAYDYLQKPVDDVDHLAAVLRRALERQQLARRNERLIRDLRLANVEIERRRRRELDYIQQIGQAMASALEAREVLQVLVQAMLNAIPCEVAAGLLLAGPHNASPWAVVTGRQSLAPGVCAALVRRMADQLPEDLRPDLADVEVYGAKEGAICAQPAENLPWEELHLVRLAALDQVEGVILVAYPGEMGRGGDEAEVLGILASQGSVALANSRLYARAHDLAVRDGLTGLYNHRYFFEVLQQHVEQARRTATRVGVVILDLDRQHGLKAINDTLGHLAGDELLRQVGVSLEAMVRHDDIVARYGGDEFVVLAPHTGEAETLALARRIRLELRERTFLIRGVEARVTASIGAAVSTVEAGDDASTVVNRADRGLYQAKESGGDQVCFVPFGEEGIPDVPK